MREPDNRDDADDDERPAPVPPHSRSIAMTARRLIRATAASAALAATIGALPAVASALAQPARPASQETHAKAKPSIKSPPQLYGQVSATGAVSLKNASGRAVTQLSGGWYTVTIAVLSKGADFHLVGPGTNRVTGKHFVGDVIWGIHFTSGTYRYMSDANVARTTHRILVR
jgi:hypothetical protein